MKDKQPVGEGDQYIFDSGGLDGNDGERKNTINRLILEDVDEDDSVKGNLN